jgi:hypothetical protein
MMAFGQNMSQYNDICEIPQKTFIIVTAMNTSHKTVFLTPTCHILLCIQEGKDTRFGTSNMRNLFRADLLTSRSKGILKCHPDVVQVQNGVRWRSDGTSTDVF